MNFKNVFWLLINKIHSISIDLTLFRNENYYYLYYQNYSMKIDYYLYKNHREIYYL